MTLQETLAGLSGRLEAAEGLDAFGEAVQGVVARAPMHGRLRSLLSGTWLGHPVHPLLVATPIGCWTSASLLDAVGQRRAARTLVGAGVMTVIPTALTGLSDWADTSGAERRVGSAHLIINTFATVAYAMSWASRRRHHRLGVALSLVGAGAATAGGWLGGHLAYAMGVGVDTNAFDGSSVDWTPLEVAVPADTLVRTAVGATPLLAVRGEHGVRVLADRCSHRGASLSEGELDGNCVICPWHASRFDLTTGTVVQGPAVAPQPVYATRVVDGTLEVKRDEPRALRSNTTHP